MTLERTTKTLQELRSQNNERGQRTTWAQAGHAASCRELAQRLSDLIHREGEYAR